MTAFEFGRSLAASLAPGHSVSVSCEEGCDTPERVRDVISGIASAGVTAHYLAAVPRSSLRSAVRSLPSDVHVHVGAQTIKLIGH